MNTKVEILGVNDTELKRVLFHNTMEEIYRTNVMPELTTTVDAKERRVQALLDYSEHNTVLVASTPSATALCIFFIEELNPHIDGRGLVMLITLAVGTDSVLPTLMHNIRKLATSNNCNWLATSKRTAPYEYRCKYRLLKGSI